MDMAKSTFKSGHKIFCISFDKFSVSLFNYWIGLSYQRVVGGLGKVTDIGFIKVVTEYQKPDAIEILADLAHQQWSGWMEYLFSKCSTGEDGTLIIPSWAVTRWKRQMDTPYRDLTETEKGLDRKEARKVYSQIDSMFT